MQQQTYLLPDYSMLLQLRLSMENRIVHAASLRRSRNSIEQSGEKIGLLHAHIKTGSFSVCSRFYSFEYKIYIIHSYYYMYFLTG
jgi:hypothetical protein